MLFSDKLIQNVNQHIEDTQLENGTGVLLVDEFQSQPRGNYCQPMSPRGDGNMTDILLVIITTLVLIAMSNAFQSGHTVFGIVGLIFALAGVCKYVTNAWREVNRKRSD